MPTGPRIIYVLYENHRGETRLRTLVPRGVWYGVTRWHPEPQYLLRCLDVEDDREKDFALLGFRGPPPVQSSQEALPR